MALIDLANPTRFLALVERVLPWLVAATVLAFAIGLRGAFLAPDDYQQGATVKIMFIHVPNAWLSMFVWAVMSAAALGTLVWRHPLADVAAKAAVPIGAAFTFLCLFTGSMWGRPDRAVATRYGSSLLSRAGTDAGAERHLRRTHLRRTPHDHAA